MNAKIAGLFLIVGIQATALMLQESEWAPVWYDLANRNEDEDYKENYRTLCDQLGTTENQKIPDVTNNNNILRIATYNIHYWEFPLHTGVKKGEAFWSILKGIQYIDADILILQEVERYQSDKGSVEEIFKQLGYTQSIFQDTSWLRNYIFAKKYVNVVDSSAKQFLTNPEGQDKEKRGFTRLKVQLPDGKTVTIYGTHLEVRDYTSNTTITKTAGDARAAQIQELVDYINQNDKNSNVIIGLDANTVRQKDLMEKIRGETVWNMYTKRAQQMNGSVSTKALDLLAQKQFVDCFEKTSILPPKFTSMYGARIDFLFLNPQWNLPIAGCYVFYTWASDHIPVIMDITIPGGIDKRSK